METKNVLMAIVLSTLVLVFWATFFEPPPVEQNTSENKIIVGSRKAFTTSASSSGAVVTYICAFSAGEGTGALTEAGVFNAASSGTMLCRTEFAVVNKGAADSMTITWTVTVS